MGVKMIEEDLPWLTNGVHIPRRRRSSSFESKLEDDRASISMMEAATTMIEMAKGSSNRKRKRMKSPMSKQRKKSPTSKQRKESPSVKQRKKEMELAKSPSEMPMPEMMRGRIVGKGGYEIQLVIVKKLEESDVNRNNGRLSLPVKKVRREFVSEEEREILEEANGKKKKKGMEVGIMNNLLKERSMLLKKWKIGSDKVYILMNNWNSFVEENGLRSGDFIQLWSFRDNNSDRLCFAFVKLSHLF